MLSPYAMGWLHSLALSHSILLLKELQVEQHLIFNFAKENYLAEACDRLRRSALSLACCLEHALEMKTQMPRCVVNADSRCLGKFW